MRFLHKTSLRVVITITVMGISVFSLSPMVLAAGTAGAGRPASQNTSAAQPATNATQSGGEQSSLKRIQRLSAIPFVKKDADLKGLVEGIYTFAIAAVSIAALLMIVIGGFWYMTSAGNQAQATNAKHIIRDAFFGLIVAFFAYLLFFTINPDILSNSIHSFSPSGGTATGGGAGGSGGGYPPDIKPNTNGGNKGTQDHQQKKQKLENAGVKIRSSGNCANQANKKCTSLDRMPDSAVNAIIGVKNSCTGCEIIVTGGTEVGHKSHGPNKPIFDLAMNSGTIKYFNENIDKTTAHHIPGYGTQYDIKSGPLKGGTVLYETENKANHFHVDTTSVS